MLVLSSLLASVGLEAQTGAPTIAATMAQIDKVVMNTGGSEVTSIFDLGPDSGGEFLAYGEKEDKIKLMRRNGQSLEAIAETSVTSTPWKATFVKVDGQRKLAIAFGYGRKNLQAPLSVVIYDQNLKDPQTVFERTGERTETTYLRPADLGLFIVFFESKYFTKLGNLSPSGSGPGAWSFSETNHIRLGSKIDRGPAGLLVGRPYGDTQGQDGDVFLIKDGVTTLLPSYRGVSSAAFWPGTVEPHPPIVLGDGWHQNYGSFAEGRLSVLDWNEKRKAYGLSLIDWDKSQFAFMDLKFIGSGPTQKLLATGSNTVFLYRYDGSWTKQILAKQTNAMQPFSVIFLEESDGMQWFAISDSGLRVIGVRS
jgi:hypothetical protein